MVPSVQVKIQTNANEELVNDWDSYILCFSQVFVMDALFCLILFFMFDDVFLNI